MGDYLKEFTAGKDTRPEVMGRRTRLTLRDREGNTLTLSIGDGPLEDFIETLTAQLRKRQAGQ